MKLGIWILQISSKTFCTKNSSPARPCTTLWLARRKTPRKQGINHQQYKLVSKRKPSVMEKVAQACLVLKPPTHTGNPKTRPAVSVLALFLQSQKMATHTQPCPLFLSLRRASNARRKLRRKKAMLDRKMRTAMKKHVGLLSVQLFLLFSASHLMNQHLKMFSRPCRYSRSKT